jgi:hypothetical protein
MRHTVLAVGLTAIGIGLAATMAAIAPPTGDHNVRTTRASGSLVVSAGGREVLRYQLEKPADVKLPVESGCYVHPLRTPAGTVVTDVAPADHPHHRGLFLAWFDMKGKKDADFWGWGAFAPVKDRRIVNREAAETPGGFRARNEWLAEGEALLVEELQAAVRTEGPANVIDLTYTLTPDADLTLPRRAFSGFCVRVPVGPKLEAFGPDGAVTLPNPHHEQPDTDWPAARWYAYGLTFDDGRTAAVAVIEHPKNPPSMWHNQRDVRMLNPCIVAPGPVTIKAGEPLVLRYRVVALDGTVPAELELLSRLSDDWAK